MDVWVNPWRDKLPSPFSVPNDRQYSITYVSFYACTTAKSQRNGNGYVYREETQNRPINKHVFK